MSTRTGAPIVKVIHHGSRVSTSSHGANHITKEEMSHVTRPGPAVFGAHLDQSTWQGYNVIHKYFPDECEALLHGRCIIVNVRSTVLTLHWHYLLIIGQTRHGVQLRPCTNTPSELPTLALYLTKISLFVPIDGSLKFENRWAFDRIRRSTNGIINSPKRPTKFWYLNSSTTLAAPGRAHIPHSLTLSMRMQSPERALRLGRLFSGLTRRRSFRVE